MPNHLADAFIMFDGDSLTAPQAPVDYPYQLMPQLHRDYNCKNLAIGGHTMDQITAHNAQNYATNHGCPFSVYVLWGGINDMWGSGNPGAAADVYAKIVAQCVAMRAAGYNKILVATLTPCKNVNVSPTYEARREGAGGINPLLRAGWSTDCHADHLIDIGGDATVGQADSPDNGTYYNADKLHFIAAGYLYVAGLVKTELLKVL
jgi:hypothetical protein